MYGMRRGTGGFKTRGLQKHSAKHLHGLRQVIKNGESICDKIISYFSDDTIQLSIVEFRKMFDYPLCHLKINLAMRLYHAICLCDDGIVRKRNNGCVDSGIAISANGLFKVK